MKLLHFLLFSFILLACKNTAVKAQDQHKTLVGTYENGKLTLTADKHKMLAAYNANLLKLSDIDAKFTEIIIQSTSDNQYYLVFKGDTYHSSFIITAVDSKLYALNTISCTTSDCASESFGCTPKSNGVACFPCSNNGKCTKTVSSGSLID